MRQMIADQPRLLDCQPLELLRPSCSRQLRLLIATGPQLRLGEGGEIGDRVTRHQTRLRTAMDHEGDMARRVASGVHRFHTPNNFRARLEQPDALFDARQPILSAYDEALT